jgi:gliding motility-associated protein GldM
MAHGKETPRQKMIGMMYLVLTAMLALNVSKDAVEAFKKVDEGLTKTVANYIRKNSGTYMEFDRAAAENPLKAGPYRDKAFTLKERADEVLTTSMTSRLKSSRPQKVKILKQLPIIKSISIR